LASESERVIGVLEGEGGKGFSKGGDAGREVGIGEDAGD
jgi:hypothetical protein